MQAAVIMLVLLLLVDKRSSKTGVGYICKLT